jgi:hypothetical protein
MREMVDEMNGRGVELIIRKGSVLDRSLVEAVKEECKEYPVRGVIQAAMVLQDARLENMSYEQWRAALDPKVQGTWNVHEVFGSSLDFFILFSSISGIVGTFSQGNYCAGNAFQDAFARYRAGLGLPGNQIPIHCDSIVADSCVGRSIDIGSVEGEGYTAENEAAAEYVRRQGLSAYKLEEFLVTVEEAIKNPVAATPTEAQLLCGVSRADPSTQTEEAAIQRPDPKFSHIWSRAAIHEQRAATSGQIDVHAVLRTCTSSEAALETTLHAVKAKLARLLAIQVDDIRTDRSIASHGMDSLIAVEFRNWLSTFMETHLQMFELMSSILLSDLALLIAKRSRLIDSTVFAES